MYLRFLLFLFIALSYVISPFDIFSEEIWGLIGVIDDIIIVLSILVYISSAYYGHLQNRAANQLH